ncbi:MAG: chemoreceptor glutamine deamidase CheD [Gemmatimonadetes bacterium]|nr:chemoreceptor glutamine deamidase CheD [Gemmatimonadota bacterium]
MSPPIFVRTGDARAAAGPAVLATLGLGPCVAILLHDPVAGIGGLAHAMLPDPAAAPAGAPAARFAARAVPLLVHEMTALGAEPGRLVAALVGGAALFEPLVCAGQRTLGARNVQAARAALAEAGIPIRAEAVGGDFGRSVYFQLSDGRIRVTAVGQPDVLLV